MPAAVFQVVLPLLWTTMIAGVAINRSRVRRRIGRDPVIVRPWGTARGGSVRGSSRALELGLGLGATVLTADVILNAVWPDAIAERLAVSGLRQSATAGYLGLFLVALGVVLAGTAVLDMGVSWRIGIDSEAPGPVVSSGIYRRIRHPIYAGMLLVVTGIAALTGDALSLVAAAGAWVGLPLQARSEETFLLTRMPDEYAAYQRGTGRFWPRMR